MKTLKRIILWILGWRQIGDAFWTEAPARLFLGIGVCWTNRVWRNIWTGGLMCSEPSIHTTPPDHPDCRCVV